MTEVSYYDLYDQSKTRITGIPFFLLHKKKNLNNQKLKNELIGQIAEEKINIQKEFEMDEHILIPELFKSTGEIILQNIIENIVVDSNILTGVITHDNILRLNYRNEKLVVIQTLRNKFQVLKDNELEQYFLIIYGSRVKIAKIFKSLREIFYRIGIVVIPAKMNPRNLDGLQKELDGSLLNTTIGDYASEKITQKLIVGKGYENDPDYLRDKEQGQVVQHRFGYTLPGDDKLWVVTISSDGLVRFYNNIDLNFYIDFVKSKILQRLEKVQKRPIDIPFESFNIFDDDEENEGSV